MLAQGLASEAEIKEIEAKVAEQVEDCVEFADASPKPVRRAGWLGWLGAGAGWRLLRWLPAAAAGCVWLAVGLLGAG